MTTLLGLSGTPSSGDLDDDLSAPDPIVWPRDLPAVLASVFVANWIDQVQVSSEYLTDVQTAPETLTEERWALRERPYRKIDVLISGMSQSAAMRLFWTIRRWGQEPFPFPIYSDVSYVTADGADSSVWCDTRWRRFYPGGRVVVLREFEADVTQAVYANISEVFEDRLVLDQVVDVVVDDLVMPCIDAQLVPNSKGVARTDQHFQVAMTVEEYEGPSAVPAITDTPTEDTYDGHPILGADIEWTGGVGITVVRDGDKISGERAGTFLPDGPSGRFLFALDILEGSREAIWPTLSFFDHRLGRCKAFWLTNPLTLWTATDADTDWIEIAADGLREDIENYLLAVSILMTDGTTVVRYLSSLEDHDDNGSVPEGSWRLNLDSTVSGLSLATIERVSSAHLVRFSKDVLEERWTTNEVCSISFDLVELIGETAVVIDDIQP